MASALDGIRVIELAGLGPSQLGAMVLADLGADVVRVDRTSAVPQLPPLDRNRELLSRGRRSIALDLKRDKGRRVALQLIEGADVLIDPYRPGVLERLGLGPSVALGINPRLVFARMTGWGQDGPLSRAAGHDLNYIGLSGALEPMGASGEPPQVPLNLVGDFGGGAMPLVIGILAALFERERSQRGQVVDVAMIDGVATLLTSILQMSAMGEWSTQRDANWISGAAPWYRVYRTADQRYVTVGPLEERFYTQLLERLGLRPDEWPQWDRALWAPLRERLAEIFLTETLDHWCDELEGTDVCFAPVLSFAEAAIHPQLATRGVYIEHDGALQPAPSPRLGRTPGEIGCPPPWAGADTWEILRELGYDSEAIRRLLELGIVRELPRDPVSKTPLEPV
jgi:alpha-methylacyl-CoA racemase